MFVSLSFVQNHSFDLESLLSLTTFLSAKSLASSGLNPSSSVRIWTVCWPTEGSGRDTTSSNADSWLESLE